MKTNRPSFGCAAAFDSEDLIELEETSLGAVSGGDGGHVVHSDIPITIRVDAPSPKLFA
jgi:hypothetical protein